MSPRPLIITKWNKYDINPIQIAKRQHEAKLIESLKQVKSSVTTDLYKHLYPQGSQPGIMCGFSKIHNPLGNTFPNLIPILSAINTGTYKWAKCFVPFLKPCTSNNYTVKDSFDFAKDIT